MFGNGLLLLTGTLAIKENSEWILFARALLARVDWVKTGGLGRRNLGGCYLAVLQDLIDHVLGNALKERPRCNGGLGSMLKHSAITIA